MSDWNPWKMTAIGMALVIVTALISGLVVASWNNSAYKSQTALGATSSTPVSTANTGPLDGGSPIPSAPAPRIVSAPRPQATPTATDVNACNAYAKQRVGDTTVETVKDALIGAAAGAGLGAAGGAIAEGGRGAGKGAGIGGVVGAAAGTIYGLNQAKSHDARYVALYRACMKGRGYSS